MIILGIETSCDETALSLIEAGSSIDLLNPRTSASPSSNIRVLADKTLSQIELHKQYGGVYPNMAKREHSRNLVPLLLAVLEEASKNDSRFSPSQISIRNFGGQEFQDSRTENFQSEELNAKRRTLNALLEREPELQKDLIGIIPQRAKPPIDAIAVTEGPGLEPCLWTGINFAQALSLVWDVPVIPINHMEGHIFSALLRRKNVIQDFRFKIQEIYFPALALLISGGHTELVLIKKGGDYEIIGETRDDAVGEAFDKVARLLGLPYPGGPEISRLADQARNLIHDSRFKIHEWKLPRPMLHSGDLDFSFSGLKTAVLYLIKKLPELTENTKLEIAREFEDAVTEVLESKTEKAIKKYGAKSILIGGGVIANKHIRETFVRLADKSQIPVFIPEQGLTTDNALMIAVAGLMHSSEKALKLQAKGNLRLEHKE